jgi:O-antigen ligase
VLSRSVRQMSVPASLRRLTIPLLILAALALGVTFSRGGWLQLLLSIAILIGAKWLRHGISWTALMTGGAAVTLFGVCFFTPNPISRWLSADDKGSMHSRVPLMHLSWSMIAAHPALGVGARAECASIHRCIKWILSGTIVSVPMHPAGSYQRKTCSCT